MLDAPVDRHPARLTTDDIAALERPIAAAEGLPGRVYVDPAFYELERQTLFRNGWVAAAFAQDLPDPGDVFPVTIAGWELLFLRTRQGEIRCYHNVCRHRGMKLVRAPAKAVRTLACPWHCWTYDLEGALIGTPNLGGPDIGEVEGLEKADLGLLPVRCEQWWNFLFIDIDGKAPPLHEHMAPLEARIGAFDRDELACNGDGFSFDYSGNWKVLVEGGIEDYHFPWVHPQLMPQGRFVPEIGGDCFRGHLQPSGGKGRQGQDGRQVAGADQQGPAPVLPLRRPGQGGDGRLHGDPQRGRRVQPGSRRDDPVRAPSP